MPCQRQRRALHAQGTMVTAGGERFVAAVGGVVRWHHHCHHCPLRAYVKYSLTLFFIQGTLTQIFVLRARGTMVTGQSSVRLTAQTLTQRSPRRWPKWWRTAPAPLPPHVIFPVRCAVPPVRLAAAVTRLRQPFGRRTPTSMLIAARATIFYVRQSKGRYGKIGGGFFGRGGNVRGVVKKRACFTWRFFPPGGPAENNHRVDHAVRPRRPSKRATVIGCHRPPRDVSMPRSLSAAAILRVERCLIGSTISRNASACRSAACLFVAAMVGLPSLTPLAFAAANAVFVLAEIMRRSCSASAA